MKIRLVTDGQPITCLHYTHAQDGVLDARTIWSFYERGGLAVLAILNVFTVRAHDASACAVQLIRDPDFQHGFHLQRPEPGRRVVCGVVRGPGGGPPVWNLAQWTSRFPFDASTPVDRAADGAFVLANPARRVAFGGSDGVLSIGVMVQNLDRQSPGYGDYLWFGIPIYDNRHRQIMTYAAPDTAGSGKFIYTPAPAPKPTPNIHDGEWTAFDLDLLPAMREGFAVARGRGYLQHLDGADDYRLGGMNLGWEMPGTYDVELQVRNLRLTAIPAPGHG